MGARPARKRANNRPISRKAATVKTKRKETPLTGPLSTVSVPPELEPVFLRAQRSKTRSLFRLPKEGMSPPWRSAYRTS